MPTKRTITRQRDEARRQLADAIDARDAAVVDADGARFTVKRLSQQIGEVRDELGALRKQATSTTTPVPATPAAGPQTVRRELLLANRARRALVDQIEELRRCNDDLSREAVDRAGNLARAETTR